MLLKRTSFVKRLGFNLIRLGLCLVVLGIGFVVIKEPVLSEEESQFQELIEQPKPVRIMIPKLTLDLEVTEAEVKRNVWQVNDLGVSHWNDSANPGEVGNMVVYGHNYDHLFGPVRWLEIGDKIYMVNEEYQVFDYTVKEVQVVSPDEVELLMPTENEQLTIYTCTGEFDSMRYVIVAE